MEWPFKDPDFDEVNLNTILKYGVGKSVALLRNCGSRRVKHWELNTDQDWLKWLNEDPFSLYLQEQRSGLGVVLAARAEETGTRNGAVLQHLPFSKEIFAQIINSFPLHGETAIVLNRSIHATFIDIDLRETEWNAIFYCCRTTSKYPGDIAISSVFYPSSGFTAAVFFGCNEGLTQDIADRLRVAENSTSHPLLIVGILVEIERERHLRLVEEKVHSAMKKVYSSKEPGPVPATSKLGGEHYSIDSWYAISQLRIELETWKIQMELMIEHIDHLEKDIFAEPCHTALGASADSLVECSPISDVTLMNTEDCREMAGKPIYQESSWRKGDPQVHEVHWRQHGRDTGRRIKKRLRVIINDYDKQIRECTTVIDGLQLDTQMTWNQIGYQDAQTNLRIARDTRRDSGQMKSIAILTMIFLPATFVSSIFSMTFFNWHPEAGEKILSPYVWIYPVVAMAITAVVLTVWWIRTRKQQSSLFEDSDIEMSEVTRR